MKTIKYILLSAVLIGFTACNDDEYDYTPDPEPLPELTAGTADFSTYVSVGNSLTSGFTDNALFIAGQQNSFPNTLSKKFALVGGGDFTQPLMNDNIGGFLFGGTPNPQFGPRLYLDLSGPSPTPKPLPDVPTTELFGPTTGPTNNMGVPGAKSYHLLFDGYGNPANLATATANPYFIRMASSPSATVLGDAMSQSPTFFSLWIGNNDVLGYALSGGDGTNPITPMDGPPGVGFVQTYATLVGVLTSGGAKGVVANIPDVTSIPHFTTVPYNPVPLDEPTAGALNQGYAPYNGGIQLAFNALNGTGLFTAEELAKRTITFSAGPANALVIIDETLTDLGAINPAFAGIPKYRQATVTDLFVLPVSSLIPLGYGTQIPLADKWVLLPSEQAEIAAATSAFNATISATATQAGLAFVDANALLNQLANGGISNSGFILNSSLVRGGAFGLDGVHPTARGYALIANMFMRAIDTTYGSNFEASGNFVDLGDYPTNYPLELR